VIGVPACVRALALAWAALLCPLASALPDDAAVGGLLAERIAQRRAVGLAAVLFDARGVRIVTSGATREGGPPVGADTEFEIGSLTKTFTALLLAEEALRGAVGLDDPVAKYLPGKAPGLTRDGKAVTLIQLASHTSGLARIAVRVDDAIAENIAGRYELGPRSVIAVRRDGDRVFARVSAQGEAEVFAESDYEYFSRVIDAQISFLRDGDGRVSGLVLHLGGRNLTARRID